MELYGSPRVLPGYSQERGARRHNQLQPLTQRVLSGYSEGTLRVLSVYSEARDARAPYQLRRLTLKGSLRGTPGYSQVPGRATPEKLQPVSLSEDAARRLQPRSVAATGPASTIAASTPASTQWAPGEDPHEYPVSTPRDAGGFRPGRAEHACGESTTCIPLRCPRVP